MNQRYRRNPEKPRGRHPLCDERVAQNLRQAVSRRNDSPIRRALNWDKSTLSRVLNGIRPIRLSEAIILQTICKIKITDLTANAPVGQ